MGNLRDGVKLKANLPSVEGNVRFYLRNRNEAWVNLDLKFCYSQLFGGGKDVRRRHYKISY